MKNKTLILMSTFNGEKYLNEQLESLLKQKNVDILIRDDGSKDNTLNIIKDYASKYENISFYSGKNLGYAKSFWNLMKQKDDYSYYAFCDQDDIWFDNKIENAVRLIDKEKKDIPLLYTSNVIGINSDKKIINNNIFNGKVLNFYESLQKSILPGCTFVFNNKAQKILKKYNGYMESHDWATYSIISCFGKVIYDENSYIYYRIHENNTIGIQSKCKKIKIKIKNFFKSNKCVRSKFAKDFYNIFKDNLNVECKKDVKKLGYYKENINYKIELIKSKKFKGLIFKFYILLNKV